MGLMEWLKVKALSLSLSTTKKKKKNQKTQKTTTTKPPIKPFQTVYSIMVVQKGVRQMQTQL
jgi:hypothetical protein